MGRQGDDHHKAKHLSTLMPSKEQDAHDFDW